MTIRVAINGYGRIGRNILRAYYDRPELSQAIDIVAINDLGEPAINAHLLEFDTAHGRFGHEVTSGADYLAVDGRRIAVLNERSPSALPLSE